MSDTPRTDRILSKATYHALFDLDFARELERENAALRATLETYSYCVDGCTCGNGWSHDAARIALASKGGQP